MTTSDIECVMSNPENFGKPKKSAIASTKKPKLPGRHITFAAEPTFFCITADEKISIPQSHGSSVCSSKVCLCSPTNHPGSFRCRLHRCNPVHKPNNFSSSSSNSESLHRRIQQAAQLYIYNGYTRCFKEPPMQSSFFPLLDGIGMEKMSLLSMVNT